MRSIKTMLLLAMAATVATALAAPGTAAAAEWTKEGSKLTHKTGSVAYFYEGVPLAEESEPVAIEGQIEFIGDDVGELACTMNATATFGTNEEGQITEAEFSACKAGAALSGCKITSITPNSLNWPIYTGPSYMAVGVVVDVVYSGLFCAAKEESIYGAYVATPDNTQAMNSWSLSGGVDATVKWKSSKKGTTTGGKDVFGTLNLSPAGKYGIGMAGDIGVGGSLKWESGLGTISCPSVGTVLLEPGSEGDITSFAWDASKCSTSGFLNSCTVTSVASKGTPWPIVDEGTKIKVSNVSFKMNTTGVFCGFTWLKVEGTMNATPDNVNSISSVELAGSMNMEFSHGGTTTGTWSGNHNWTPAGVYGL